MMTWTPGPAEASTVSTSHMERRHGGPALHHFPAADVTSLFYQDYHLLLNVNIAVHVHVRACACACVRVCVCACVFTSVRAGDSINRLKVGWSARPNLRPLTPPPSHVHTVLCPPTATPPHHHHPPTPITNTCGKHLSGTLACLSASTAVHVILINLFWSQMRQARVSVQLQQQPKKKYI